MSGLLPILLEEGTTNLNLFHPYMLISFCLFMFFLYRYLQLDSTAKKKLPPSPPKLPVIGNLHQFSAYPHRSLQSLSRKHGDLMLLKMGKVPFLIANSAKAAHEILKTHDESFLQRPDTYLSQKLLYNRKDLAFAPPGDYWRQMRTIFMLHISSNTRVRSYSGVRDDETALMVQKIKQSVSRELNMTELFMNLTNNVICRVAFGKKYEEAKMPHHKKVLDELNEVLGSFAMRDFIPWLAWIDRLNGLEAKVNRVAREVDKLIEGIIQEHLDSQDTDPNVHESGEGDKMKDVVDVLLELQMDKTTNIPIDTESIKAILMDIFVGGTDTTYTTLEWAMAELLKHPRIMSELQHEIRGIMGDKMKVTEGDLEKMTYLKAVLKETLRLHPSFSLTIPREVTQDTKIMGYDIPRGTSILVNIWAIQRDPGYWNEPEDFCPERFLDSHVDFRGTDFNLIPFGAGRRGCPGMSFAMAINELVLANLVHTFNWVLPGATESHSLDMTEAISITRHRKFPLIAVPSLP